MKVLETYLFTPIEIGTRPNDAKRILRYIKGTTQKLSLRGN